MYIPAIRGLHKTNKVENSRKQYTHMLTLRCNLAYSTRHKCLGHARKLCLLVYYTNTVLGVALKPGLLPPQPRRLLEGEGLVCRLKTQYTKLYTRSAGQHAAQCANKSMDFTAQTVDGNYQLFCSKRGSRVCTARSADGANPHFALNIYT